MELKWTILCFLAAVFILGNSENWMAGGNFTQEEFATLRAKVDNFNKTLDRVQYTAAAKTMSNELNDLWHPAWNVFIAYYWNGDFVLYGYAFHNRWFWFNGFEMEDNRLISFVIWKDFNCVTWFEFDETNNPLYSSYSGAVANNIQSTIAADNALPVRDLSDIWKVAQHIQSKIPSSDNTLFQDPLAYTIVASSTFTTTFARFCAVGYAFVNSMGRNSVKASGSALILQMRSS